MEPVDLDLYIDSDWFVDPKALIADGLECSVDQSICRDVVESFCGHFFCAKCMKRIVEHDPRCPLCRAVFDPANPNNYHPSASAQRKINAALAICPCCIKKPNHWTGRFGDLAKHLQACEYALVKCELCEKYVQRNCLAQHKEQLVSLSCPSVFAFSFSVFEEPSIFAFASMLPL